MAESPLVVALLAMAAVNCERWCEGLSCRAEVHLISFRVGICRDAELWNTGVASSW
jgi:hypothetical protein